MFYVRLLQCNLISFVAVGALGEVEGYSWTEIHSHAAGEHMLT